jgi:hypothetical protein
MQNSIDLLCHIFWELILLSARLDDQVDFSENGMPINTNIARVTFVCLKTSQGLESWPSKLDYSGESVVKLEGSNLIWLKVFFIFLKDGNIQ